VKTSDVVVVGPAFEKVLPFLRALGTTSTTGTPTFTAEPAPCRCTSQPMTGPITALFAEAADELGFPSEPDKNDQGTPGFGPVPRNVKDGVRWNTGLAFVVPALRRPNFTVLGGCTVRRIRFRGTRVVGLDIHAEGMDRRWTRTPWCCRPEPSNPRIC
jgi:choline dehydrogenase